MRWPQFQKGGDIAEDAASTSLKGQSPSSRGHHGVEEQVSPIAPRTPLKIYEENEDGGTSQLPNRGSDASGPSRLGIDCGPVMPVPPRVVKKVKRKKKPQRLRKDREHAP